MNLGIYAKKEPDLAVALKHLAAEEADPCPKAEEFRQEHFQAILRGLSTARNR